MSLTKLNEIENIRIVKNDFGKKQYDIIMENQNKNKSNITILAMLKEYLLVFNY